MDAARDQPPDALARIKGGQEGHETEHHHVDRAVLRKEAIGDEIDQRADENAFNGPHTADHDDEDGDIGPTRIKAGRRRDAQLRHVVDGAGKPRAHRRGHEDQEAQPLDVHPLAFGGDRIVAHRRQGKAVARAQQPIAAADRHQKHRGAKPHQSDLPLMQGILAHDAKRHARACVDIVDVQHDELYRFRHHPGADGEIRTVETVQQRIGRKRQKTRDENADPDRQKRIDAEIRSQHEHRIARHADKGLLTDGDKPRISGKQVPHLGNGQVDGKLHHPAHMTGLPPPGHRDHGGQDEERDSRGNAAGPSVTDNDMGRFGRKRSGIGRRDGVCQCHGFNLCSSGPADGWPAR
ncbi:hypothetical protein AT6N2_C3024 [Agrobacterium tumefaciens]|nr:hypothetical protein AT6N2_C3024 [Agrobacterium tumefaciens]